MDNSSLTPAPYRVGLVLINGFALMSYASVVEPLRAANLLSGKPLFEVVNLSAEGDSATSSFGVLVPATQTLQSELPLDLIFVVAGGDPSKFTDRKVFDWLRARARMGVTLGGISGGPVILAAAGLMEGRRMTVHWEHAPALQEISPTLLVERSLYVVDRDRITCAGGIAPLDLMNMLISLQHGADFAQKVSDWFLQTQIRPAENPQRADNIARYGVTNRPVVDAISAMEAHIADPLTLSEIAKIAGVSERQLNRLFKTKMGQSTQAFYRQIRLETAKGLLNNSSLSVTEIALITGFSDTAHFSRSFQEAYGQSPSSLRAG